MKFTSSRYLVLAAYGHALVFNKGDTLFVPPVLRDAAIDLGLEPVEGDEDTHSRTKDGHHDEKARTDAIKDAMRAIAKRNNAGDFDAGGVPKVRAIRDLSGGAEPTDAKERTALWAEVSNDVKA